MLIKYLIFSQSVDELFPGNVAILGINTLQKQKIYFTERSFQKIYFLPKQD